MPNCLYLTLSVCEFVILCIVTVLYFFNVLCNCVKVCNIVDWLLSFEWGWMGPGHVSQGQIVALDVWIGVGED